MIENVAEQDNALSMEEEAVDRLCPAEEEDQRTPAVSVEEGGDEASWAED